MSKRLWILPVLAAVLIAAGSGAGYASMPSLLGGTGIVSLPNAEIAPMGQLQTAVVYQRLEAIGIDMYNEEFTNETASLWGIQALAGVANGAELWAAYSKDNSDADMKTWSLGGKFQIPTGDKSVNLAVGANYRQGKGEFPTFLSVDEFDPLLVFSDQFDIKGTNWDAYLVATADLTALTKSTCTSGRFLGSLGVIYKNFKVDLTDNWADIYDGAVVDTGSDGFNVVDENLTKPFLAVEFLGQDRTSLGLEYRWKDSELDAKAVFSAVLRHDFEQGITASVGVTNADQFGLGMDDQNWFAMIGYNFGFGK